MPIVPLVDNDDATLLLEDADVIVDVTANDSGFTDNFYFDGDIDQVAIYKQALTVDDVNASFAAGAANQPLEFAPVFNTTDFGQTALGYQFSTNVNAVASPSITGYALGAAPAAMNLDTSNGDVSWTPTNLDIGPVVFNVTATNTLGTTAQDLSVEVVDACASVAAYWDLNETAEPFDGEVFIEAIHPDDNDAACIDSGCPTVDADAEAINGALAFDGSTQGLQVAASAGKDQVFDWSANESFTIAFFMKPNISGFAPGSTEVMLGRWLEGNYQWWIGLRENGGGTPRLYARLEAVNGDGDNLPITDTVSPTAFSDGTWYHVAMVYNNTAGTVSLYIEGVLEVMENISYDAGTDFAEGTNPLNIGYLFDGSKNDFFYGGSLDEIVFFGEALDASVLLQHATQERPGRGFCNDAPSINSTPVLTADAGVEYTYAATAEADAEGDAYTWSLTDKPDDMAIDADTGAVSWTPTNADADAPVQVTVMVTDGFGGADSQSFEIQVTASANVAPVIEGQTAVSIATNATYTIKLADLTITDPDSTTFTLNVLPGASYTVTGDTVTPDSGFTGDLTVSITVSDEVNESASFPFVITVSDTTTPATSDGGGGGGGGGCFIDSSMY
jgi:hypothetical protein